MKNEYKSRYIKMNERRYMPELRSSLTKLLILPAADRAMKTNIALYLNAIKKMHYMSREEIVKWQNAQLKKLILHAYNNTSYYRKMFMRQSIKPDDISTIEDLQKLPVLTKNDIRNNYEYLVSSNINAIPHKRASTGGSTGDPLIYLLDNRSWSFSTANQIINWEKTPYRYGDKHIALGSSSLFVETKKSLKHNLYYGIKRKIGLNGINMSDEVCRKYLEFIKKERISFVYGYASAIYLLASYVLRYDEKVEIIACFPTSEVLTDKFRNTIEEAFKCIIVDGYGANDGGISAFEHKRGFYEVGYNSIITGGNYNEKEVFPILLTDLLNYAMPLINYQIGDEVKMEASQNNNCKYNGQIINKILGRTSELICLENGTVLTGPGFTIMMKDLPVEYYYIEKNGVNSIKCSIKTYSNFTREHENIIISTLEKQMGSDARIEINYTDEVFLTKSGKRKYFGN